MDLLETGASRGRPRAVVYLLGAMTVGAAIVLGACDDQSATAANDRTTSTTATRTPAKARPTQLRLMTYNVCFTEPWCSDAAGSPSVATRTARVNARVRASAPDVLAVQEGSALFNGVTDMAYTSAGEPAPRIKTRTRDARPGSSSTYFTKRTTGRAYTVVFDPAASYAGVGIYVNATTLDVVEVGGVPAVRTVRVGTDPEVPDNGATERRTPRYAVFVHLRSKASGQTFWVGNVHTSDGTTPVEKAERLSQVRNTAVALRDLGGPSVLLGDFNEARTTSEDRLLGALTSIDPTAVDAKDLAQDLRHAKYSSYQGWGTTPRTTSAASGNHIDRIILTGDWQVARWATAGPLSGRTWASVASDHIPVVTVASLLPSD